MQGTLSDCLLCTVPPQPARRSLAPTPPSAATNDVALPNSITGFFQYQAKLLNSGRLGRLSQDYALPLAIFEDGKIHVQTSKTTLLDGLIANRALIFSKGVTLARVADVVLDPEEGERIPALVTWEFLGADGVVIASSELRYYLERKGPNAWQIAMVEYLKLAFPESLTVIPVDGSTD